MNFKYMRTFEKDQLSEEEFVEKDKIKNSKFFKVQKLIAFRIKRGRQSSKKVKNHPGAD